MAASFALSFGGLRLVPLRKREAALAVLATIFSVTAFILAIDLLFRHSLPQGYVEAFTSPLVPRLFENCLLAVGEEVKYRLLVMTALIVLVAMWRGSVSPRWFVAAILLSQLVYVLPWLITDPIYATLRFWAVGCVWGWLYWRYGWVSAVLGHVGTHLMLDPLMLIVLSK